MIIKRADIAKFLADKLISKSSLLLQQMGQITNIHNYTLAIDSSNISKIILAG